LWAPALMFYNSKVNYLEDVFNVKSDNAKKIFKSGIRWRHISKKSLKCWEVFFKINYCGDVVKRNCDLKKMFCIKTFPRDLESILKIDLWIEPWARRSIAGFIDRQTNKLINKWADEYSGVICFSILTSNILQMSNIKSDVAKMLKSGTRRTHFQEILKMF